MLTNISLISYFIFEPSGVEIGPVSCTGSKREQAAEPADLYMPSTFFSNAREYVEEN
jgi:hypothetical protein